LADQAWGESALFRRSTTCSRDKPVIPIRLRRPVCPPTTSTLDRGNSSTPATRFSTARFARSSTGGALTFSLRPRHEPPRSHLEQPAAGRKRRSTHRPSTPLRKETTPSSGPDVARSPTDQLCPAANRPRNRTSVATPTHPSTMPAIAIPRPDPCPPDLSIWFLAL
jgi:hypothetical protein